MNVYVRDLTRYLGRKGVKVDVFTRSQDEHVPHILHDLGYGNRVVHVPAGPESPMPKEELVKFLPDFVKGIQEFDARNRSMGLSYDLIHSHYWMSGLAARELKAAWGVPVVHMFHTLGVMKQRVARPEEKVEGDYRLNGEHEVLRFADRIIAATPAEMAQLQWLYQADTHKIVIIPPGVDVSRFYPILPDEAKEVIGVAPCDRVLLFVGRIEPLKGVDTLIRAIALMRAQGVYTCLSVIGGDPSPDSIAGASEAATTEMERLMAMCNEAGVSDLVAFLGKRGQDTLPYYYSAAEAVVVPSHYESFGMVALEAMACGTPVVASQVGGLAFLVQDGVTGFTVPVDEPQALADRLALLIRDPQLRKRLGDQALDVARGYAWENITDRIIHLYEQVLEDKGLVD
jgi:D-inositol-3-phosphate glycosyltransferase